MKKQKIFFGNKVEYNKITVNESRDGAFSEETIRLDVIKEKKDDVLFDIEDKSKCKTNIKIKCIRCKKIILVNMKNPVISSKRD